MKFVLGWVKRIVKRKIKMNYKIQTLNGFNMYFDQITSVFKSRYDTGTSRFAKRIQR